MPVDILAIPSKAAIMEAFRSRDTPEEVKDPMKKVFITGGLTVVLAWLVLAAGALAETPVKPSPAPVLLS